MRLSTFIIVCFIAVIQGCEINLDERKGKYSPFILGGDGKIAYPEGSRILTFGDGDQITLFCHGTDRKKNALKGSSVGLSGSPESLDLICKDSQFVTLEGEAISDLYKASCKRVMEPEVVREDQSDCSKGVGADGRTEDLEKITLVRVGWKFGDHFEEQYQACIDEKVSYSKKTQVSAIKALLGTDNQLPDGTPIIENSSSGTNYFAKGHLSPDAAFIDEAEQDATYFYFNVAPQFQSFNNGNWKALEYATRTMAETSGNVKVWTGTFGVLSYPDVNNNDADIYVYVKGDLKLVPAPKYYWKVLQGDDGKFAGFVGLNDPHSPDIAAEDAFCNSVCNEIHGVGWDVEEEAKGHMVCCTYEELKAKIPFVPDLGDDVDLDTDITEP